MSSSKQTFYISSNFIFRHGHPGGKSAWFVNVTCSFMSWIKLQEKHAQTYSIRPWKLSGVIGNKFPKVKSEISYLFRVCFCCNELKVYINISSIFSLKILLYFRLIPEMLQTGHSLVAALNYRTPHETRVCQNKPETILLSSWNGDRRVDKTMQLGVTKSALLYHIISYS